MSAVRLATGLLVLALAPAARAQDCASYVQFQEGASITTATMNPKGKETSRTVSTTKKAAATETGQQAEVHAEVLDGKGKPVSVVDYTAACEAGKVTIDMRAFLPNEQVEAYKDYEMKLEASALEYPTGLAAGASLPDGTITATFTMKDAPANMPGSTSKLEVVLKNRKVAGQESVTTPAGTFDAWKIEYDTETALTGLIPVRTSYHVVEWYVPGIGAVKSETSSKGKPLGTSQVVELKRP